ncbi:uncharacterized protein LOC143258703 isoform X1 [Tachypleus tridentatus]|uniref:uncharacterized protein LOC143258703 isoform X1 n=1 Tax=Tachypleus tridentatus TaxID=6853 RepID=UPI003FD135AF
MRGKSWMNTLDPIHQNRFALLNSRRTTKERVYCHICNKTFGRKQDLDAHLSLHLHKSYRKKYYCSVCNKAFLWRNNMWVFSLSFMQEGFYFFYKYEETLSHPAWWGTILLL